jgi:hypothetical protein
MRIADATQVDSAAMKTIAMLGLLFLPGTFVCVSDLWSINTKISYTTDFILGNLQHNIFQLHSRQRY